MKVKHLESVDKNRKTKEYQIFELFVMILN